MVIAKFRCNSIARDLGSRWDGKASVPVEIHTVHLTPVYDANPESENGKFWNATPSGEIKLGCVNAAAAAAFQLGKEYYVEFKPAE